MPDACERPANKIHGMPGCPDCARVKNLKRSLRLAKAALEQHVALDIQVAPGGPTVREVLEEAIAC